MSEARRYSEGHTAAILTRALELSARNPKDGLSLEEIEHVGREVGLDAVDVRRAAIEVPEASDFAPSFAPKGQRSAAKLRGVRHESVIVGELDDAGRQAVFHAVRTHVPTARARALGGVMIFESIGGLAISVASAHNRTRIVVQRQRRVPKEPSKAVGWMAFAVLAGSFVSVAAEDIAQAGLLLAGIGAATLPLMGLVMALRPLTKKLQAYVQRTTLEAFQGIAADVEAHLLAANNHHDVDAEAVVDPGPA